MNKKLLWVIALVLFLGVALSAAASSDLPGPLPTPLPGPFSLKVTVLLDNGDGTTSPAVGYTVAFASPFLSTDFGGSATFLTTDASGVATYTNLFNTSIMVQLPGPYFDGPEKWVAMSKTSSRPSSS